MDEDKIVQHDCSTALSASTVLAPRFRTLFAGMDTAYGTYTVGDTRREDGKLEGRAVTVRSTVTDQLWKAHLEGRQGLGIIPIMADNTVNWGCIDVDVYSDLDPGRVASTIERLKLPLVPCRSKSLGLHLYCFTLAPVSAAKMQSKLKEIAASLGHGTAEVFPKQTKILIDRDDLGSWVNMPYFAGDTTTRYAVRPNGDAMTIVEFLATAEAIRVSAEWIAHPLPTRADVLPDGPPCLQHLIGLGFPQGQRNRGLFNLAVYARKSDADNWKDLVQSLNQTHMVPPLAHDEVSQVIKSVDRKEYGYTCSDPALGAHCSRSTCRRRKWGVGRNGANALPVLNSLSKLCTDPPVWFLEVEGHRLELTTAELLNPLVFQEKCANHDVIVPVVKRSVWTEHLRPAMDSVNRIPVSDDGSDADDSSAAGHFLHLLEQFCIGRATGHSMSDVLIGKPYTEGERTYFRFFALLTYLARMGFKDFRRNDVVAVLKAQGATNRQERIGGKVTRVWSVPAFARGDDKPLDFPPGLIDSKPF